MSHTSVSPRLRVSASPCSTPRPARAKAHSPGQHPGGWCRDEARPARAKAYIHNACLLMLLPFQGALRRLTYPGRCPGLCAYWAFSPLLGRLLTIQGIGKCRTEGRAGQRKMRGREKMRDRGKCGGREKMRDRGKCGGREKCGAEPRSSKQTLRIFRKLKNILSVASCLCVQRLALQGQKLIAQGNTLGDCVAIRHALQGQKHHS